MWKFPKVVGSRRMSLFNQLVIFRLALLFLITKLLRIFEVAIIYVGKHSDIRSPPRRLDEKRRRGLFLSAALGLV